MSDDLAGSIVTANPLAVDCDKHPFVSEPLKAASRIASFVLLRLVALTCAFRAKALVKMRRDKRFSASLAHPLPRIDECIARNLNFSRQRDRAFDHMRTPVIVRLR